MKKHWLDGPRRYNENGELQVGDEPVVANPAFRFGVQRGEELRAVGYLKRSSTNGATFVPTPINLPSWADAARACSLFQLGGGSSPLPISPKRIMLTHTSSSRQLRGTSSRRQFP